MALLKGIGRHLLLKHCVLFLLTCAWTMVVGVCQQPYCKNYQVKDGLLSNYTYFVFQDSKGYIWVSNDVGVSRFDGHRFSNYNTSNGMSDNEVFSMYEDRKGRLWFATLNGKPCYFKDGVVYSEKNHELLQRCNLNGMVSQIFERPNGTIVYATHSRILSIDLEAMHHQTSEIPQGFFCTFNGGGRQANPSSIQMAALRQDSLIRFHPLPALGGTIRTLQIGNDLLIGCLHQLFLSHLQGSRIEKTIDLLVKGNEIIYLKAHKDKLWVGTRNGFFIYDYPGLRLNKSFLPGRSVTSAAEDQEGGLWLSTLEEGFFYIPTPDILHFTTQEGLLFDRIACFARDSMQRLWVGSEGSAYSIYDGKHLKTRQILREYARNKAIFNIRHFSNGKTLVIGKAGTLILQHGQEQYLYHRASDINIDANGDYWAALGGLYKIPREDIPFKVFPPEWIGTPKGPPCYLVKITRKMSELRSEKIDFDAQQHIWMAASTGLYKYLPAEHEEMQILPFVTKDVLFDKSTQILWALTESNGLFAFRDGRLVDSIAIVNNQGTVICRDLCQDAEGNLWIGSAGGLFRVSGSPGNLQRSNYWGVFGLGTEKINAVEVIGNYVYIGKDDGFLQIPKNVLQQPAPAPSIQVTAIRIANTTMKAPCPDRITLSYGHQPLSIEFQGLSFREAQNLSYRYRLTGFEENWHTTTNLAVEYAALRPGTYLFEVYALNGSDVPSVLPARVQLLVLRPFWLSGWFVFCMSGFLLLAALGYIRRREALIQRKFEIERRLVEGKRENSELQKKNTDLRMLSLRLQMNPHFIFNALNTIKGYIGQGKEKEVNTFINKFSRLLRLNLEYSNALVSLEQEIELLNVYIYLTQVRYPGKIAVVFGIDPEIKPREMYIPSMLLQPFVENAVIHGVVPKSIGGKISISFKKVGECIRVSIQDDGIGREVALVSKLNTAHKPFATQITLERLRLLQPDFEGEPLSVHDLFDENGNVSGTEVLLFIPYSTQYST